MSAKRQSWKLLLGGILAAAMGLMVVLLPGSLSKPAPAALPTLAQLPGGETGSDTLSDAVLTTPVPIPLNNPAETIETSAGSTTTVQQPEDNSNVFTVSLPGQTIPNTAVVHFKPGTTRRQQIDYVASFGGQISSRIDALNTVVINVPENVDVPDSALIEASEPDYYAAALSAPMNDPFYSEQWALPVIGIPDVWDALPVSTSVVNVAVIDSGVCLTHPDLQGQIGAGWDFIENDAVPQDEYGHGCAVTGVIAAVRDNATGIAGVASNVNILPLRVLNSKGAGAYSNVAAAIVYAVDNGAHIINLSLGGSSPSNLLEDAVNYAAAHDVTLIAAAGNQGSNTVMYPAAYASVVAVGSVDRDLQRSSFSNYGAATDIYAPGRDIVTTTLSGYGYMSGTSLAAPYVTGVEVLNRALGLTLTLDGGILKINALPPTPPTAEPEIIEIATCDRTLAQAAQTAFLEAVARNGANPPTATDADVLAARLHYLEVAQPCFVEAYNRGTLTIDSGARTGAGVQVNPQFVAFGTKWGASSPFTRSTPPGVSGGVVTYSFTPDAVSLTGEEGAASNIIIDIDSLTAGGTGCNLKDEIRSAFTYWQSASDITFVEVPDNGLPFNAPGATFGQIRVGAHVIDGGGGELGHAYFPPPDPTEPNATGSGDIHFDEGEAWGCSTVEIAGNLEQLDIGLVAQHEIGHAIGLEHQQRQPVDIPAMMNPTYNRSTTADNGLLPDDEDGARAIYGTNAVGIPNTFARDPRDEVLSDNLPVLEWDALAGVTEFQVQLDDNSDFSSPLVDTSITGGALSYQVTAPLPNGTFFWRVRAFFNGGWLAWTNSATFSVSIDVPSLIAPINNALLSSTTVQFQWSDVSGDNNLFTLQIATDATFTNIVRNEVNITGTTRAATLSGGVYFWRVGEGVNNWSLVRRFTVDEDVPLLSAPANNALLTDGSVSLSWLPVSGASQYQVQIDTSPNFVGLLFLDRLFLDRLFLDRLFLDRLFLDRLFLDRLFLDRLFLDRLFLDRLFLDRLFLDRLFLDRLFLDRLFLDRLFLDRLFLDRLFIDKIVDTSYALPKPLSDGTHYWRVRARRADGTWTGWSEHYQLTVQTPGRFNVRINEVQLEDPSWVEIYNAGSDAVDLTTWKLIAYTPAGALDLDYAFPPGFTLPAGGYVVLHEADGIDTPTSLYMGEDTIHFVLAGEVLGASAPAEVEFTPEQLAMLVQLAGSLPPPDDASAQTTSPDAPTIPLNNAPETPAPDNMTPLLDSAPAQGAALVSLTTDVRGAPQTQAATASDDGISAQSVINVTTTNMTVASDGLCNLIEAIEAANTNVTVDGDCTAGTAGLDTIELQPGMTYTLTAILDTAEGDTGLPRVTEDLIINGSGATITRDSGAPDFRLFLVAPVTLTLNDVTLSNGRATAALTDRGGAIHTSLSNIVLNRVTITGSHADDAGGAIYLEQASLTAVDTTFSNNTVGGSGGAVYATGFSTVATDRATFSGNSATSGGAMVVDGTTALLNTTIAENTGSGALISYGTTTLDFVTVTANTGGGIAQAGSTLTVKNSIVALQTSGDDCIGIISDGGGNYSGTASSCVEGGFGFNETGSLNLDTLQGNGGLVDTVALLTGSTAINNADDCETIAAVVVGEDARGVARPMNGNCDAGAFESTEGDDAQAGPDFNVNTTAITDDGVCGEAHCSLIEAIDAANADPGHSIITLGSSAEYVLTGGSYVASGDNGLPSVTGDVVFNGFGATIRRQLYGCDASPKFRLFHVAATGILTLNNVTLENGCDNSGNGGGAIFVAGGGELILDTAFLVNNTTTSDGGAIATGPSSITTIQDSAALSGNHADGFGGAIDNFMGEVNITDSALNVNSSSGNGGAIANRSDGFNATLTITGSTFNGNNAAQGGAILLNAVDTGESNASITTTTFDSNTGNEGGAILADGCTFGSLTITRSTFIDSTAGTAGAIGYHCTMGGSMEITNTTFSGSRAGNAAAIDSSGTTKLSFVTIADSDDNSEGSTFGVLRRVGGTFTIKNSIIARTDGDECAGTIDSPGGNFTDGACTGFTSVTDTELGLGTLGNNGGPTLSYALNFDPPSVAINGAADCLDVDGDTVLADQDNASRPQSFRCDSGTYEAITASIPLNMTVTTTLIAPANDGECGLIEVIKAANIDGFSGTTPGECRSGGGADIITLDSSETYTLTDADNTSANGANGLPLITGEMTINGSESVIERSGGAPEFRFFEVTATGSLTLNDLTLSDGDAAAEHGGAVYVNGATTLNAVLLLNNQADAGGGAVYMEGGGLTVTDSSFVGNISNSGTNGGAIGANPLSTTPLSVTHSIFTTNFSTQNGGAIGAGTFAELTIERSLFSGNTAAGNGGALAIFSHDASVVNTTFSNNIAVGGFGAIYKGGGANPLNLNFITVTQNNGGGLYNELNGITVKNSIIADQSTGNNCDGLIGGIAPQGVNFANETTCGPGFTNTASPLIEASLANNGGGTLTHALAPSSPAKDATTDCTVIGGGVDLPIDQRGVSRPQGLECDAGAFEEAGSVAQPGPDYVVNTGTMTDDGVCATGGGCSLIDAIRAANADGADSFILLGDALTYTLENSVSGDPFSGLPPITSPVTMMGNASTIRRNPLAAEKFRIIAVAPAGSLTLLDTHIEGGDLNGTIAEGGAGILVHGNLTMDGGSVHNNSADVGAGILNSPGAPGFLMTLTDVEIYQNTGTQSGGIYNGLFTSAVINNGSIHDNNSDTESGGIHNRGKLTLNGGSISHNNCATCDGVGLHHESGDTLTITGTAFEDNQTLAGSGGGLFNTGDATLTGVAFDINTSTDKGGAIRNTGTLAMTGGSFNSNEANIGGGVSNTGTLTITGVTFTFNEGIDGGAVTNGGGGTATFRSTTFDRNLASEDGGALYNGVLDGTSGGTMKLVNVTLAENNAGQTGGALLVENNAVLHVTGSTFLDNNSGTLSETIMVASSGGETVIFKNSIISSNVSNNCDDPNSRITVQGVNFSTDAGCAGFTQAAYFELNLGSLFDNGGSTQTVSLGSGSVAIDSVDDCTIIGGGGIITDQRGVSRPQGAKCDAGAFEAAGLTLGTTGGSLALVQGVSGVDFVRFGDTVLATPAGTNWTGAAVDLPVGGMTLGRNPNSADSDDRLDWSAQQASKGGQNQVKVLINELGTGVVDFIEIVNAGIETARIGGWTLTIYDADGVIDAAYTFPADATIPPGGYVVIRESAGVTTPTEIYIAPQDITWANWNGAGAVVLTNSAGFGADYVRFGDSGIQEQSIPAENDDPDPQFMGALDLSGVPVPPGTGWSGTSPISPLPNQSLGRDAQSSDFDLGSDWFSASASPGTVNPITRPAPNDLLANVTIITRLPFRDTQSTTAATRTPEEPTVSCGVNVDHTLWYRYTATETKPLRFQTDGSDFNTVLAIYDTTHNEIACNDDHAGAAHSRIDLTVTAGETYLIMAGGNLFAAGNLTFSVQPPVNDSLLDALPVTALPFTDNQDTTAASQTITDPIPGCNTGVGRSVWYSFTAATANKVLITTLGSDFDTTVSVFTGEPGSLVEVACNDDGGTDNTSTLAFTPVPGTTYFIMAAGSQDAGGSLVFEMRLVVAPDNDLVENATLISLPYERTQDTIGATISEGDVVPSCGVNVGKTVWYKYHAETDAPVIFETVNSGFDTVMAIYTGTPGSLTEVDCSDDALANKISQLEIAAPLMGTDYFIQVGGYQNEGGSLVFRAYTPGDAPFNDEFVNAMPVNELDLPFEFTQDTTGATVNIADPIPSCASNIGKTVWYSYQSFTGRQLRIQTSGANYDTALAVYGDFGSLTELACNNDSGGALQSQVIVNVADNTTVYIVVGGYSGAAGSLHLTIEEVAPGTENDLIENAIEITPLPFADSRSTVLATSSGDDPADSCGIAGAKTVWYVYHATPEGGVLHLDTHGSSYDTVLSVWTEEEGSLVEAACNDDSGGDTSSVEVSLTPSATYYVMVSGSNGASGELVLNAELLPAPSNDLIENAIPLASGDMIVLDAAEPVDTRAATSSLTDPAVCNPSTGKTVWYLLTVEEFGTLHLSTAGSDFNTVLAVFSGAPGNLTLEACDDNGGANLTSRIESLMLTEGDYYVMVGGAFGQGGTLLLEAQLIQAPPNDEFENAPLISVPGTTTEQTNGATPNASDPMVCGTVVTHTVWYTYEAPANGVLNITFEGTDFSYVFAVFTGSPGSLNEILCQVGGELELDVTPGQTYYILMGSGGGSGGTLSFTATLLPAAVSLAVSQIAVPASVSEPGGVVDFAITVTNTSAVDSVTLTEVLDNDINITGSCDTLVLNPGAFATCAYQNSILGQPGDPKVNTVKASGIGSDTANTPVSAVNSLNVNITDVASSMTAGLTASPNSVPLPGGTVNYTLTVTNTGAVDAISVTGINSDKFGAVTTCNSPLPAALPVSGVLTCEFSGLVSGASPHVNTVTVNATDDDGTLLSKSASAEVTLNHLTLNGLRGEYFDNIDFTAAKVSRLDPTINFNWGSGKPHSSIDKDTFSIRWLGEIQPDFTETYTFSVFSDNGARLWINNQLVVDDFIEHPPHEVSGTIDLVAGQRYDIRLDYYENKGGAGVRLFWQSASRPRQIVPSAKLFAFLPPLADAGPDQVVTAGELQTAAVLLDGSASVDDGSITGYVWKIGSIIIATGAQPTVTLPTGTHVITLTVTDNDGLTATDSVTIKVAPFGSGGLNAEYFDNINFTAPTLARIDPTINFTWGVGSPDAAIQKDTFSVRWLGQILGDFTETYTFYLHSDNGARLWVNNQLIIDDFIEHPPHEVSATFAMTAGQRYDIRLDYYENKGAASVKLAWESASVPRQIVPATHLFNILSPLALAAADEVVDVEPYLVLDDMEALSVVEPLAVPEAVPPSPVVVGLYRDGIWHSGSSVNAPGVSLAFDAGGPGWTPLAGDFDGDGVTDLGLYRAGTWVLRSINGDTVFIFGTDELPVVGDWNNDGIDTPGLYKDGIWQLRNSNSAGTADLTLAFGEAGWIPLAGDFDGDGFDTPGLYQNGAWTLNNSLVDATAVNAFAYGPAEPGWTPLAGDFDGDGFDSIGLYQAGTWRLRNSNDAGAPDTGFSFGTAEAGWLPVAGYPVSVDVLLALSQKGAVVLPAVTEIAAETVTVVPTESVTALPTEEVLATETPAETASSEVTPEALPEVTPEAAPVTPEALPTEAAAATETPAAEESPGVTETPSGTPPAPEATPLPTEEAAQAEGE